MPRGGDAVEHLLDAPALAAQGLKVATMEWFWAAR